jgi:hypothetical protein
VVTVSVITVPFAVPAFTLYTMEKDPDAPAATLASVQGLAGNPAQVHPAGGVIETNAVFAGVDSVSVPLVIAVVPVFVTTWVYVMLLPACTGFGDAELVTDKFGPVPPTTVLAVARLLVETGSVADDATDTEFVMTVPLATPVFTLTIIVNVPEVPPAMFVSVQTILPVLPAPGLEQVHPEGAVIETSVVFAGTDVAKVALSPALGPLSVTTCV